MKALIAFILMAVGILTLIEVNERVKAKKSKRDRACQKSKEDCPKEQSDASACTDCSLIELCEKKPTAAQ